MDERRKLPRFAVTVEIHWKKISQDGLRTAQHISHTKDASAVGACVVLHPSIVPGDMLHVEIQLPNNKMIAADGKVIWVNPCARVKGWSGAVYEGGIEFLGLSETERYELGQFLVLNTKPHSRK